MDASDAPHDSRLVRRTTRPRVCDVRARPAIPGAARFAGLTRLKSRTASALPRLAVEAHHAYGGESRRVNAAAQFPAKSGALPEECGWRVGSRDEISDPRKYDEDQPDGDLTAESLPGPRRRNRTATRPMADKPSQRLRRRPACKYAAHTTAQSTSDAAAASLPSIRPRRWRRRAFIRRCGRRGTAIFCKHRYRLICRTSLKAGSS